jgi:hypothetical protein
MLWRGRIPFVRISRERSGRSACTTWSYQSQPSRCGTYSTEHGLGLRAPAISWGVLLQDAQNLQAVALAPWLMLPALPLIVTIMAFNFLGDGLRDAADPYAR